MVSRIPIIHLLIDRFVSNTSGYNDLLGFIFVIFLSYYSDEYQMQSFSSRVSMRFRFSLRYQYRGNSKSQFTSISLKHKSVGSLHRLFVFRLKITFTSRVRVFSAGIPSFILPKEVLFHKDKFEILIRNIEHFYTPMCSS